MGSPRRELIPGPALAAALAKGVPPLVALVGADSFLKTDALRLVREAMGSDVEVESFDGPRNDQEAASFDPASVLDALRTGLLFGDRRVVAVRRADRFLREQGDAVVRSLERPSEGVVLVLFLDRLDKRRKLGKLVASMGLEVTCRKLYDAPPPWEKGRTPPHENELTRWTTERARKHGKRISLETAYRLTQHTGNDPGRVDTLLESLSVLVGERPEIDAAAVDELVSGAGEQTVFQVRDEVLDGRGREAVRSLETAYRHGLEMFGKPVRDPKGVAMIVINQLQKGLTQMYRARRALEGGLSRGEVVEAFGPRQRGFVSTFERQLARYDEPTLRRALRDLTALDRASKSGRTPEGVDLALLTFVVDLCRRPPPERGAVRRTERSRPWA